MSVYLVASNTEKRKVVLGITGSIAAYKSAELVRILVTRGYEVRVVMTRSAQEFITPLTFEVLTGKPVITEFWKEPVPGEISHIALADWADLIVIAPATAEFIAKLSIGSAETPLLAICLATKAPMLLAPAMNVNMLEHSQTQANIIALQKRSINFVPTETGDLACGWTGSGRLAEPKEIFAHIRKELTIQDFAGKRVLITTGPTREAIDPVRFIGNRSSGKMGVALAKEAFRRGANVTLVHGPVEVDVPKPINLIAVTSASEMQQSVMSELYPNNKKQSDYDLVIMAAAVADYRPEAVKSKKIKKSSAPNSIPVVQNPDILALLGGQRAKAKSPHLVGFAVETGEVEDLIAEVRRKMKDKNVDMMIGNLASDAFERQTNRVWIMTKAGKVEEVATTYKARVAARIFDAITKLG